MELNYHLANYIGWPVPALYLCSVQSLLHIAKIQKIPESCNFFRNYFTPKSKVFSVKYCCKKKAKNNEDKTIQYSLEAKKDIDLRKIVFNEFSKENITIFEMKKADITLEDAFMKVIEGGNKQCCQL